MALTSSTTAIDYILKSLLESLSCVQTGTLDFQVWWEDKPGGWDCLLTPPPTTTDDGGTPLVLRDGYSNTLPKLGTTLLDKTPHLAPVAPIAPADCNRDGSDLDMCIGC